MTTELTDLVLRGRRVVTPDGLRPASVHVRGEIITRVADYADIADLDSRRVVEAGESVVQPGLVDTHVHVNEPGRSEWEGFTTATRAAAAGGVTTILDMPLNSVPPTTTTAGLEEKRHAARGNCHVDVGFIAGIVPGNLNELPALAEAGVFAFKAFLAPSGVEEFGHVGASGLDAAMARLAPYDPLVMVHAEAAGRLDPGACRDDPRSYRGWLASHPDGAEVDAVAAVGELAMRHGTGTHVLHLSSAAALAPLRRARARDGALLSAETCPHYLAFAAEEVPDGATVFKCAPPIRDGTNREMLWAALAAGDVQAVVSDHSPSPPELKPEGDFHAAWGGIASLELRLPVLWTEGAARGFGLTDIARWSCSEPARLAGMDGRKGAIAPGLDADLTIWDPDSTFTVDPSDLQQRHPLTPYAGRELRGRVLSTYLRGHRVWPADRPRGELLRRQER